MLLIALLSACKAPEAPLVNESDADADTDSDTDADTDTDADADTDTDADPPIELDLVVHPGQPLLRAGDTLQLRSRVIEAAGGSSNVTDSSWQGSGAFVSITSDGLLTGIAPGQQSLRCSQQGWVNDPWVTVYATTDSLSALALVPALPTSAPGTTVVFAAWATTVAGHQGDVSPNCAWSSSDSSVASIGAGGATTALQTGTTTITAQCDDGLTASTELQVGPTQPTNLSLTAIEHSLVANDRFRVRVQLQNDGGLSPPVALGFHSDSFVAPAEGPDTRVSAPSLATGDSIWIESEHLYSDARPASLNTWVVVDSTGVSDDPAPGILHTPVELPADVVANIRVSFDGITVFGPTDAGVIFTVTNDGPADLTDLVVYFDRDNPAALALTDVEAATSEAFEMIPTLASGASYLWLFTYDQVPSPDPWTSCGYVFADGFVDPDLSDNLACGVFPAY